MTAPVVRSDFHAWEAETPVTSLAPVVIIGGGPTGIRAAQELSRRGIACTLFNAERWQPYNRVKLTSLLCGDAQIGQILQTLTFPGPGKVTLYSNQSVIDVDRVAHTVTTRVGRILEYSRLIFATGSRAHIPPIPGIGLAGVFSFRSADDVEKLIARSFRSRRAMVIGGGLLGLEAARGMANRGTETWVIEHAPTLMPRQLDARGGIRLAGIIEGLGIKVRTGTGVAEILGDGRVEGIRFTNGDKLTCDTIIVCTGIRANMEMAREIGLPVGRGITVTDRMQTRDPDIYAIGECAEFEGHVQGLVGPGFEQAIIAADAIAEGSGRYTGAVPASKLKIVGIDVISMGDVEQLDQRHDVRTIRFEDGTGSLYRCLVLRQRRLVGALAVGDWAGITRIQEAVRARRIIAPWQLYRFAGTGEVWGKSTPTSVHSWPRNATVCNCTGVTRGQIGDAIATGASSLEDIRRDTGASTVCGSCRVHIAELLGAPPKRVPLPAWRGLGAISLLAGLMVLITFATPIWPTASSVSGAGFVEHLWLDGFWKQASGFGLLGLCVLAALLALRKRLRWLNFGGYAAWRFVHLALGALALALLFAHTGFRLGANLNLWLMTCFLALALGGAAAGLTTALEHRLFTLPAPAARLRAAAFWLHVLAFWPLPLLLAMHVLTVYFY